jgi:hypothetical protein
MNDSLAAQQVFRFMREANSEISKLKLSNAELAAELELVKTEHAAALTAIGQARVKKDLTILDKFSAASRKRLDERLEAARLTNKEQS